MPVIEFYQVYTALERDSCRLPHDHLLDKPEELEKLSGEVKPLRLEDWENVSRVDQKCEGVIISE